ncbi:hypothetical protein [Streptomyces sp. LMG1-1-1.1]|uniref:hypothetical protein n=1 Tax=Streptomyces sp. LMG1-1-1.1 TaxID=3135245 RepID=UPI0034665C38
MTQNGQGPEPQYPAVPPAHDGAHGGTQPWGGAWGPAGGQPGGQPLPPAQPLPPEAAPGAADMQSTQYLSPIPPQQGSQTQQGSHTQQASQTPQAPQPFPQQAQAQPGYGYPHPGGPAAGDMQATQHIAPVPGAMPPVQAQQPGYGYPPPAAQAAGDMQATQFIAPVPPQQGAGSATQFLGTGPLPQQGAGQGGGPAGASDATRFIAPVPGQGSGERQPPAEFDSLFRTEAPQAPRAPQHPQPTQGYQQQPAPPAYQQQPPQQGFQPPQPPQSQQYGYEDAYYDDEPAPRRKSPVALIAAVVIGCAVVGLGAGALLSGGDEEKDPKGGGQNVAATSAAPSTGAPAEKPADPAEAQARELSSLLATSSSSRDTVIGSVESIKQCKNLDKAATDLRGAAEQRRGLVTKLQSLSVDQIPDNTALTAALTKAWQASASADDHYAAWADQMKSKKACKGGKARSTDQLVAANAKSGEATTAKKKAAGLWNPTAAKYGLEKRTYSQL